MNPTTREKWLALAAGEDPGPMVSPLCDDWSLDAPYAWPLDEPEPFPAGHRLHAISQQIAMAEVCGWDPTFLAGAPMPPKADVNPQNETSEHDGITRTRSVINTPYGELSCITEQKTTMHTVEPWLSTREDYDRMAWVMQQRMDYDEQPAIEQGRQLREAIGQRGILGTWWGPPSGCLMRENMHYHLADWPDACKKLIDANRELSFKQLETLRRAGFDYLFYCVDGTEWISPRFFREHILDDTRETFRRWREMGGFILWHSCGQIARFVEEGFYNELKPEILETVSEPPVGNLPSLRWARQKLDSAIVTKGNMPLNILLHGTPDDVREDVRRIRTETAGYRHVVGLSDDILKNTPVENAKASAEEGHKT